jgi:site-specific recombinase XerD
MEEIEMKELQLVNPEAELMLPEETKEQMRSILISGISKNTLKSYHKDLRYYWTYIKLRLQKEESYPIPESDILIFLTEHFTKIPEEVEDQMIRLGVKRKKGPLKYATIKRRLFTISAFHTKQGLLNPCKSIMVRELMSKARRAMILAGVEVDKKAPAVKSVIEKLIATCDDSLVGKRDKALILVAFSSGGRRRSELANFRIEDVEKLSDGRFQLRMYHSKSDYSGKPKLFPAVGLSGSALQDYLESTGITAGPLFRNISKHGSILDGLSSIGIQHVFKKRCKLAGLDEEAMSSRSLRSGFVTECLNQSKPLHTIKALTGHSSFKSLEDYAIGVSVINEASDLL